MSFKTSKSEKIGQASIVIFLILFSFVCLYPFINLLAIAFNDGMDSMRGGIYFFPREFTLANFEMVLEDARTLNSFFVTLGRTVIGTSLGLFVNAMFAYAVCRKSLPGRKLLIWFASVPLFFSPGLTPTYIAYDSLGILDSFWVFVLPMLAWPLYIMMLRVAFDSVPQSLDEAAKIDGAGEGRIFFRIYLPLTIPSLVTVGLFAVILHWNNWYDGTIYVTGSELWPLQTLLLNMIQGADISSMLDYGGSVSTSTYTAESLRAAMMIVTVLPIAMIYPFAQKYFIKGAMTGAVKE